MWRYVATTLRGDGTERDPIPDVPLTDVTVTKVLSEWATLDAKLTPEQPVDLVAWSSCVYVLHGSTVVAACIVESVEEEGATVSVSGIGFAGVPQDLPWTGPDRSYVGANSGDVYREIWDHIQSQPGGNLGMTVTPFTTAAWVGTTDNPFILKGSETSDLSASLVELVDDGIEYRERHTLAGSHVLESGKVGDDRTSLRFELGENLSGAIKIRQAARDRPTELILVGDPELGVWGRATTGETGRLRRVQRYTDANAKTTEQANARAAERLSAYASRRQSFTVTARDTIETPISAVDVGDTITIGGPTWSGRITATCRITSITYRPGDATAELDLFPV